MYAWRMSFEYFRKVKKQSGETQVQIYFLFKIKYNYCLLSILVVEIIPTF